MKYLFDPDGVFTSALLRNVDIVLPEGTIVSALPPDGAVFLYYEQNQAMMSALLRAFAQALGPAAMAGDRGGTDIHMAFGAHADGTPWVSVAQCGGEIGPFGANAHGDADSQMLSYLANGIAVAAEAVEAEVPVVVLRHEIVPDSAGAGFNRGGASIVRDSLWLEPALHSLMTLRAKRAAGFGVNGGADGATGGVWVYEPGGDGTAPEPTLGPDSYTDATPLAGVVHPETNAPDLEGRYVYPYGEPVHPTAAGSALRYVNHGGGGWGDPFDARARAGRSSTFATATSRSRARRATTAWWWSVIPTPIPRASPSTLPRPSSCAPSGPDAEVGRARRIGRDRHGRRRRRRPGGRPAPVGCGSCGRGRGPRPGRHWSSRHRDGRVVAVLGDVAESGTARAAVDTALERFGRLDILVNNAARFLLKPTLETTDEEWDEVLRTNVRGVFVHSREALPRLAEGNGGAIVNLASISGVVGLSDQAAYSASKGAIVQLTRQLAVEWSRRGVRVNAVAPGAIDTPFLRNALAGAPDVDEVLAQIAASHPLGTDLRPGRDRRDGALPGVAALAVRDGRDPDGRRRLHRSVVSRCTAAPG